MRAVLEFYKLDEETAKTAAAALAIYLKIAHGQDTDALFETCESPMERRFLLPVVTGNSRVLEYGRTWCRFENCGEEFAVFLQTEQFDPDEDDDCDDDPTVFARTDFRLIQRKPRRHFSIVIEIDGHDFHEKTKEQAQRDKARDRKLVRLGHYVLRFTGSEVHADPWACWKEVFDVAQSLSDQEGTRDYDIRQNILDELTAPAKAPELPAHQEMATGSTDGETSSSASSESSQASEGAT